LLYVGAAIGGIGAGVIYGASVGNALKWFPDRRGLAAGLTAAGFGAGSALTVVPIADMIQSSGYEAAFLWFGLGQGIIVVLVGIPLPALTVALSLHRVANVLPRPLFGWVSDHIGRENTMFIAFMLEGIGIYALLLVADNPLLFVILSGVVFFAWGEIYSLFPATCTDIYGRKFATTNYGMLYTAKGTAALLLPPANVLTTATGTWNAVFIVAAALNIAAAILALVALRPMRLRPMAQA